MGYNYKKFPTDLSLRPSAYNTTQSTIKSQNLGIVETSAVVFITIYKGKLDAHPTATKTYASSPREDTENALSITCTHSSGKYVESIARAFRLAVPDTVLNSIDVADTDREFPFEAPTRCSGHQFPQQDTWGVYGHNDQHCVGLGGARIPRNIWNRSKYHFSDPDIYIFGVKNQNGYANHPDY